MNSLITYDRNFSNTLSTTQKIGSFISFACAITFGSSVAIAGTDSLKTGHDNQNIIANTLKVKSIISSTGLRFLIDKSSELPRFSVELVNKQIEKFMTSLENNEDIFYEDDLVSLAQQVIKDNPDAFKNFI